MGERRVLIGMSGVGKSYAAAVLGRAGAHVIDCDARIQARLGDLVTVGPGETPVTALGRWMGLPASEGYRAREAKYLALEEEITREAVDEALGHDDVVIDTTGSVVHLPDDVLTRLRSVGRVRYYAVSADRIASMLARYLAEPKPVVFGAAWRGAGDDLARSYAELLAWRAERYARLADETLPAYAG